MLHRLSTLIRLASGAAALAFCTTAGAMLVVVTVTVENLAPANSVSFAPLRLGFGNGTFDAFNTGETATAPIISVAEGGSGSAWFPAFAAAEPNAVLGSVGGALLPGATASSSFVVDSSVNRLFTFGSMVIPSNDPFIGNDLLSADTSIYRISFAVSDVPDPGTFILMTAGLLAIGWTTRRRRAEPALPGLASI